MKLLWTPDLEVGIAEIDDQHKELFGKINDLRSAIHEGKGAEMINTTSRFLADYVLEHFSKEEQVMNKIDYPDYQLHKSEHTAFMRDLVGFKKNLDRLQVEGGITSFLVIEMHRRLHGWLLHHIGKEDKAFGDFMMSKHLS